jgi:hypothetical protein
VAMEEGKMEDGGRMMNVVAGYGGMGPMDDDWGDLVVICGDWWWLMVGLCFSEGGRRAGWFVGCGNDGVKMMGVRAVT